MEVVCVRTAEWPLPTLHNVKHRRRAMSLQLRGIHIRRDVLPSRYLFVDVDSKGFLHVRVVKSVEQLPEEVDFFVLFHAVDDVLNLERGVQLYCIHVFLLF